MALDSDALHSGIPYYNCASRSCLRQSKVIDTNVYIQVWAVLVLYHKYVL